MGKAFWVDTLERAIKTAAQTAIAAIGTTAIITDVNWGIVLSTAGLSVVMSVLMSVASAGLGDKGTASVVRKRGE